MNEKLAILQLFSARRWYINFPIALRDFSAAARKHNGRIYIQSKVCAWPGHGAHIIRAVVINLMAKVARWKTFQIKASRNSSAHSASCSIQSERGGRGALSVGKQPRKTRLTSLQLIFNFIKKFIQWIYNSIFMSSRMGKGDETS